MTLAAVLCCAMTTAMFTACSSDKDDDDKPINEPTYVAAVMDSRFTVSADMLNKFDLFVEYYDENGKVQKEQLTQTEWKKSVKANLPAKLGARLKAQLKSGIETEGVRFDITYGHYYKCYAVSSKGFTGLGATSEENMSGGVIGSEVYDWVKKIGDDMVSYLYSFDSEGTPTVASW